MKKIPRRLMDLIQALNRALDEHMKGRIHDRVKRRAKPLRILPILLKSNSHSASFKPGKSPEGVCSCPVVPAEITCM